MLRFRDLVGAGFLTVLFHRLVSGGKGRLLSFILLLAVGTGWVFVRILKLIGSLFSFLFRNSKNAAVGELWKLRSEVRKFGDRANKPRLVEFAGRECATLTVTGDWRTDSSSLFFVCELDSSRFRIYKRTPEGRTEELPVFVLREAGIDPPLTDISVRRIREVYRKLRIHRY